MTAVIDGFDNVVLDDWDGDEDAFETQESTVYSGSRALRYIPGSGLARIHSTSGLDAYPSFGDTFEARMQIGNTGTSAGLLWAVDEAGNAFAFGWDGTFFNSWFLVDPSGRLIGGGGSAPNTDEMLRLEVRWEDPIVCIAENADGTEVANLSVSSSAHQSETGVGVRANDDGTGASIYFDELRNLSAPSPIAVSGEYDTGVDVGGEWGVEHAVTGDWTVEHAVTGEFG